MNRDLLHIHLMLDAIAAIDRYIEAKDEEVFLRNEILRDACLMQLMQIGENGGKVSQTFKNEFSEVEWQQMKAARNFFAHAYDFVEWPRVWETINEVLPGLKIKLQNILESLEQENNGKTN